MSTSGSGHDEVIATVTELYILLFTEPIRSGWHAISAARNIALGMIAFGFHNVSI